ncbi:MAG: hypothetical protein FJ288_00635 [Planctomycetes bacterium]|nr:hypothetical protein [Planctomycetota bacterium]
MLLRFRELVVLVLLSAALTGCAAAPEAPAARMPPEADAAGPRAAVVRWHRALAEGDKQAYLAGFVGSQDELVLALAIFESIQAAYEFQKAVTAAYGPEAWKVFEADDASRVDIFPRDAAWPGRVTVVRLGGAALAYTPRGRVPLHLSESGGAWRIHAAGLVPPGMDARRAARYLFQWAEALRKLAAQVAGKGVPAERASRDVIVNFEARLAPEERPAAAAAKAAASY